MDNPAKPLSGVRVLVIEDEMVQALRLGDMLAELGGTVAKTAYGYEQARAAIDGQDFDCAILDINLNGTLSFPIAETLRQRGIPFVFCTAYAAAVDVYPGAAEVRCVDKPVLSEDLRDAILEVLAAAPR